MKQAYFGFLWLAKTSFATQRLVYDMMTNSHLYNLLQSCDTLAVFIVTHVFGAVGSLATTTDDEDVNSRIADTQCNIIQVQ